MKLFLIFHINICFSSIEESERKQVIKRCYWPLLNLIQELKIPVGIEASGYSLEEIKKIDPEFIKKLKFLIKKKYCELIGSGYSQLIGPLTPSKISDYNLKIGNKIYSKYLKTNPKIALINEQAFSAGIVDNYLDNGYKTIIMDWDNCFKSNIEIKKKYFFFPQKVSSSTKRRINVIWSSSILFQKFQRFAQSEIGIDEYINFIKSKKLNNKNSSMCIYASDLEAINYRTKRYKAESKIEKSEWNRIKCLIKKLLEKNFIFIKPSGALNSNRNKYSFNNLEFKNPAFPCLTKKQQKYNILRWAVTGRNDNKINSYCWKIFYHFKRNNIKDLNHWKKLCYFWSSDFRTHITLKRWKNYLKQLNLYIKKINFKHEKYKASKVNKYRNISLKKYQEKIYIKGKHIEILLNPKRGCSIEKFYDKRVSNNYLFGFVPHGYYEDISHGVDFYSGHLVIEPLGKHKITDLFKINHRIKNWKNGLIVSSFFKNNFGKFGKDIIFDNKNSKIGIKYNINFKKNINGSIRLSHITLNPEIFKKDLYYQTHNGGKIFEKFNLNQKSFDHGEAVSHLISANQAIGLTENLVNLGDKSKKICINIDRNFDAQVGMISFKKVNKKNFFRLYFSVKEHDDTSRYIKNFNTKVVTWISANKSNHK